MIRKDLKGVEVDEDEEVTRSRAGWREQCAGLEGDMARDIARVQLV